MSEKSPPRAPGGLEGVKEDLGGVFLGSEEGFDAFEGSKVLFGGATLLSCCLFGEDFAFDEADP